MNRQSLALHRIVSMALIVLALAAAARGQSNTSIINSPHNLSAGGPGAIHATAEQEVCIFCHTPHNSAPVQPLWNRSMPANPYTIYSSNSMDASPGQPTGSSKLCLSCHDGTIAIGSVLSRDQTIHMAGGITTLPPGQKSNLGTDLSDDHPISFRYDEALAAKDARLRSPSQLPSQVRLDAQREMQCTSCHDAHDDSRGAFLVMDNSNSQLCASCHNLGRTEVAGHAQCAACHQSHTAPSGQHLLKGVTVAETCGDCHSGGVGATQGPNVLVDMRKISRHERELATGGAMPATIAPDPSSVSCNDCHESHTMMTGTASAPLVSPKLGLIGGINASGAAVPRAQYQYEVCFKCHNTQPVVQPLVSRQIAQADTRLEFAPSAVSFHPVEVSGKNSDVPSLRPGLTTASLIYCTDCHASDTGKLAGGGGADGPHGSNISPLLLAGYETTDGTSESAGAYALCYRCHERTSILANQSFTLHSRHIVDNRTPCSVCHDSHGISSAQGTTTNNSRLMNFDISVVQKDPVTGRLEYRNTGMRSGECYLSCHGVAHSPKSYPVMAAPIAQPIAPQPIAPLPQSPAPLSPVAPAP